MATLPICSLAFSTVQYTVGTVIDLSIAGYLSPNGLCFQCDNVQPVQDDPRLEDMNVKQIADSFVLQMQQRASISRTNHIMVLLGGDFQYENANVMFKVEKIE